MARTEQLGEVSVGWREKIADHGEPARSRLIRALVAGASSSACRRTTSSAPACAWCAAGAASSDRSAHRWRHNIHRFDVPSMTTSNVPVHPRHRRAPRPGGKRLDVSSLSVMPSDKHAFHEIRCGAEVVRSLRPCDTSRSLMAMRVAGPYRPSRGIYKEFEATLRQEKQGRLDGVGIRIMEDDSAEFSGHEGPREGAGRRRRGPVRDTTSHGGSATGRTSCKAGCARRSARRRPATRSTVRLDAR